MKTLRLLFAVSLLALTAFAQEKPTYPVAEAASHVGEEATVTGKVVAVTKSGKGNTFLNFGDRFPRQTFSGVIFASSEEAVGDVKQYEGKEVAVTGRIEMSPEQKPQIVIKKAEQIRLLDPAAPAPPK